jgi:hypothetical protein
MYAQKLGIVLAMRRAASTAAANVSNISASCSAVARAASNTLLTQTIGTDGIGWHSALLQPIAAARSYYRTPKRHARACGNTMRLGLSGPMAQILAEQYTVTRPVPHLVNLT